MKDRNASDSNCTTRRAQCRSAYFILVFFMFCPGVMAQKAPPLADKSLVSLEDQPLRMDAATLRTAPTTSTQTVIPINGATDLSRLVIGLVIVIGVMFALRWAARRMSLVPGPVNLGAVRVISRSPVAPRQQILVLQVGKRLVVVGDSAGNMNPLCEISDPDEVAAIIGGSRAVSSETNPRSFTSLFRKAAEPFDDVPMLAQTMQNVEPVDAATNEEVGGLIDKVRILRQQFHQTRDVATSD